jgi:Tc5 transposase DNA-binding domain
MSPPQGSRARIAHVPAWVRKDLLELLNEVQVKRAPRTNEHPFFIRFLSLSRLSSMESSTKEARLELALEDIRKQTSPNWLGTARKFQVDRETLKRRFTGVQQSRSDTNAEFHQCLSTAQEKTLIGYINSLTDRGLPPTSQIVYNMAIELAKRPINKNWVSDFVKRYKDQLSSVYLRIIDNKRVKADSIPSLERFYNLVSLYIAYIIYI